MPTEDPAASVSGMRETMAMELERALERPKCPACGAARIRPTDVCDGRHLSFECPSPGCAWLGKVALPEIRKKLIYLDSSTVGSMAKALRAGEDGSPWVVLYQALRTAARKQVVSCPLSWLVRTEAELSPHADLITQVGHALGDPGLRDDLSVKHAQLLRALDCYLAGQPPEFTTTPPRQDAFCRDPHEWDPIFRVCVRTAFPWMALEALRANKEQWRDNAQDQLERYSREGLDYHAIRANELRCVGEGHLAQGTRPTFGLVRTTLTTVHGMAHDAAFQEAADFLRGEHAAKTPFADITASLLAGMAMKCRGATPRRPKPSDYFDILHIATYLPYVDIFVADRFFADLCSGPPVSLADTYDAEAIAVPKKGIDAFIRRVDKLVEVAPQANLRDRIMRVVHEGGYHEESQRRIAAYIRARGWDSGDLDQGPDTKQR